MHSWADSWENRPFGYGVNFVDIRSGVGCAIPVREALPTIGCWMCDRSIIDFTVLKLFKTVNMPAKDLFHHVVKRSLQKDGWNVTTEDYRLSFGGVDIYVDIAAERLICAERDHQKIAVEIKSFIKASTVNEFHGALGQFINYRVVLRYQDPDRVLYLAVPSSIYESFFKLEFTQIIIREQALKLIVYNPELEVIEQWID